jgi:hypothetical protein
MTASNAAMTLFWRWCPSTLSVWKEMESAMALSYFGLHAEALSHGREWFRKPEWPPYAAWWIKDCKFPSWGEAVTRHEHLHDHGPSPFAFTFKTAFDDLGATVKIDGNKVKRVAMSAASPLLG